MKDIVRIGGASGFWGDSVCGPIQLAKAPQLDFMTFDYLAELTLSVLAAQRAKNPELGYATDFVDVALSRILKQCLERGVKLISNAGGLNPRACAKAVRRLAEELGCTVRVAVVDGDDVMALLPAMRSSGMTDLDTGVVMPERMTSANAYLGAMPIARALDAGADIVITGRVVDSAVVLGALIHEFRWKGDAYELLAAGSLAGHIVECGAQATGGLHTDWATIPDWANMAYPIVEVSRDGSFQLTKAPGTGGRILVAAVAEQLLYEIGDPTAYLLPDVSCDFSAVRITQVDEHHVDVRGAVGTAPNDAYKVSATFVDGYRCIASLTIVGLDAVAKARRTGTAIIERTRTLFGAADFGDYSAVGVSVLGAEDAYGPNARQYPLREAVVRVAVRHANKQALKLFSREIAAAGTRWAPGTVGSLVSGRPAVSALVRLFSFVIPKTLVTAQLTVDGKRIDMPLSQAAPPCSRSASAPSFDGVPLPVADAGDVVVELVKIAWTRSGDKGDTVQHWRHCAQPRFAAVPSARGHSRAGSDVAGSRGSRRSDTLLGARHQRRQFRASARAGRWRHGLAAKRSTRQGDGPDPAQHAGAGARRTGGVSAKRHMSQWRTHQRVRHSLARRHLSEAASVAQCARSALRGERRTAEPESLLDVFPSEPALIHF